MTMSSSTAKKAAKALLTLLLIQFTLQHAVSLLSVAYDIRMHALRTYGYIIHEVSAASPLN